jgi:glycosyltransferase involved in cell wall biosynthesis
MKVLYVGPYYFSDSFESIEMVAYVFRDLFEAIESSCKRIYMLTCKDIPGAIQLELQKLTKLKIVPATTYGRSVVNGISRHLEMIRSGVRLVEDENIDVITNISGDLVYGFDAAFIGKLTKKRVVLRVPGDGVVSARYGGRYQSWGRIILPIDLLRRKVAYHWADKIIAMTPIEKNRLIKFVNSADKIVVCPRGVDTSKFTAHKAKRKDDDNLKVLYIGRKSKVKGYDLFIKAAKILKHIESIQFEIIGDFDYQRIKNITFHGRVHPDNLPDVYDKVDVVALPSRSEGLPQVLVEAMSMGRATIIAKHLFDSYFPADATLFCETSAQSLADKVQYLLENPHMVWEMGRNARVFVQKYLSRESQAKLYRSVILPQ